MTAGLINETSPFKAALREEAYRKGWQRADYAKNPSPRTSFSPPAFRASLAELVRGRTRTEDSVFDRLETCEKTVNYLFELRCLILRETPAWLWIYALC
jgi:hypothetical protein